MQCSGVRPGVLDRFVRRLEYRLIRQADAAYTGSRVTADFLRRQHRLDVTTIPGPAVLECQAAKQLPAGVPERYLMHFGRIGLQKGAADLAAALNLAWQHEPELAMVWAGSEIEPGAVAAYQQSWSTQAHRVLWLRHLGRPELYALLQRALAAVLPSRVDSLPNTAIESLLFGIPLIGTIGASLDEVIEPGRNGLLVPIGDPAALANALLQVWRNEVPWKSSGWQPPAVLAEMAPDCVAKKLLELAGLDAQSPVSELRA